MAPQLRVPGHTLVGEGGLHWKADCAACHAECPHRLHRDGERIYGPGGGHGLCSCGEMSEHLPSAAARKRWHRAHKLTVRPR